MEERTLNMMFAKNGQGRATTRISMPLPWVKTMGLSENDRQVKVCFDGEKITIEKANS